MKQTNFKTLVLQDKMGLINLKKENVLRDVFVLYSIALFVGRMERLMEMHVRLVVQK